MKNIIWFFLLLNTLSFAQMQNGQYGNEWIQYGQKYYKLKVTKSGLHRISAAQLQQAGISSHQLPQLQLFHLGQELPLHLEMQGSQLDYVLFYAAKSDNYLDGELYNHFSQQLNPSYALHNDTSSYFLTVNPQASPKRIQSRTADLTQLPVKEKYCWYETEISAQSQWSGGTQYFVSGIYFTKGLYEVGEGWAGPLKTHQTITLPAEELYLQGVDSELSVRMYHHGDNAHYLQIRCNNHLVHDFNVSGEKVVEHQISVPLNKLSNQNSIQLKTIGGAKDQFRFSTASLKYPHTFNLNQSTQFAFSLDASSARQYLEFTNFRNSGGQAVYLYDLTNHKRIQCYWDGSKVHVDLAPSASARNLLLVDANSSSTYTQTGSLTEVQFQDLRLSQADYIIITHSRLRQASDGTDPVLEYAAFRASTGFQPLIVSVDELYNQFGYGVDYHPRAIKNFIQHIANNWPRAAYVFLIGKGRNYQEIRSYVPANHLVPTFGYPGSDNLLAAQRGAIAPAIPIGRLSAVNGDEVATYLQKIKSTEEFRKNYPAQQAWSKNIIHLGGGATDIERRSFQGILDARKENAVFSQMGANVHSFYKEPESGNQTFSQATLDSVISEGAGMITFLGHGLNNSWDVNAYFADRYQNHPKYPLILSLACDNGKLNENARLMSERFIFEPQGGAVAYLAFNQTVTVTSANVFSYEFYQQMGGDLYGAGTGMHIQQAIASLENDPYGRTHLALLLNYISFHGDPAFAVSSAATPDFKVDTLYAVEEKISTEKDHFLLNVELVNTGRSVIDKMEVELMQELPDGSEQSITVQNIVAPANKKTLSFIIPLEIGQEGLHKYWLNIDTNDSIVERPAPIAESNNISKKYEVQVDAKSLQLIHPANFAITSAPKFTIQKQQDIAITFEIGMDANFNQLIKDTTIYSAEVSVQWEPSIVWIDSTVYYWRVKQEGDHEWKNRSFMYWESVDFGWNQSQMAQYKENELNQLLINYDLNQFEFDYTTEEISLNNGFTSVIADEQLASFHNGNLVEKCRCPNEQGVMVQVYDAAQQQFWTLPGGTAPFGAINCDAAGRTTASFLFKTNSTYQQQQLLYFLKDSIPSGHHVLIYSLNDASADLWSGDLISYLDGEGAKELANLQAAPGGLPWAFFYQKSVAGKAEALGANQQEIIHLTGKFVQSGNRGQMHTQIFGPVASWDRLDWATKFGGNQSKVEVYGISETGEKYFLMELHQQIDTSLQNIDASRFPFLQLVWKNESNWNGPSDQLKYWRVYAQELPDLAISQHIIRDTIQTGEQLNLDFDIIQLNTNDIDSIWVSYEWLGRDKELMEKVSLSNFNKNLAMNSWSLNQAHGWQQIKISINADRHLAESTYTNNTLILEVYIDKGPALVLENNSTMDVHIQNYPNPFTEQTQFSLNFGNQQVPEQLQVRIYDVSGHEVYSKQWEQGEILPGANPNLLTWKGTNQAGQVLNGGTYFYYIEGQHAGQQLHFQSGKLILQ